MSRRKGIIHEDVVWTIVVWIMAIIVILAMFATFLYFHFTGNKPLSYSVKFVDVVNRPYVLSDVLSNLSISSENFFMQALKSSITEKPTRQFIRTSRNS